MNSYELNNKRIPPYDSPLKRINELTNRILTIKISLKGGIHMENHPIMIPLNYAIWLVIASCVILLIPLVWDCIYWSREKNTCSRMTEAGLNVFRFILYLGALCYIIYGANSAPVIIYPPSWSQYLLVPIEYAATLPLLALEGIGGAYNLLLKFLSYKFD